MDVQLVSNAVTVVKHIAHIRNEVRFAQAKALTATAKELVKVSNRHTEKAFDKPTPFTRRSAGMKWATKSSLKAQVFIKDVQAGYLELEETGGTRRPKRRYLPIPSATRKNQYGNMPRNALDTLLARPSTFIAEINGTVGIWERVTNKTARGRGGKGRRLRLLVNFATQARYGKKFHWRAKMAKDARVIFPRKYADALRKVFGT